MPEKTQQEIDFNILDQKALSQPLVKHLYTADPSAHVFDGKIYIYPSHDIDAGIAFNDNGDHFGMEDYHVFSMETIDSPVIDHGCVLHVSQVEWAQRQMWAPDAACKNNRYYLYFPAKKEDGIFQIGVASSHLPTGPFLPEPLPIKGSYSIDPAVFEDTDGTHYMYFGGIWGGQLQHYRNNNYDEENVEPTANQAALGPIIARLDHTMKEFAETPKEIMILDQNGKPLLASDTERRFFEASWMHKYKGVYYFSYSTGDTHLICYATGDTPYGPFTYKGVILEPVVGWTSHHSICEVDDQWYLFYHDSSLSKGITHLRSMKCTQLIHNTDGSIETISPYGNIAQDKHF